MAEVTPVPEKIEVSLPYMPNYSSSFEVGNPAYATMIVQGIFFITNTSKN